MKKRLVLIGIGMLLILAILINFGVFSSSTMLFNGSVVQAAGGVVYLPIIENSVIVAPTPSATPNPTPTQRPSPTATATQGPAIHDVQVGASIDQFSPQMVTIHVGDTVRWTWVSDFHTVTSGSVPGTADGKFCSPSNSNCSTVTPSNTGAVYTRTFTQVGSFPYFCQIHYFMGMTGTVNVIP